MFSANTSANMTQVILSICFVQVKPNLIILCQDLLDSKMDKRKKGVYGPAAGKKFFIYVDVNNNQFIFPLLNECYLNLPSWKGFEYAQKRGIWGAAPD